MLHFPSPSLPPRLLFTALCLIRSLLLPHSPSFHPTSHSVCGRPRSSSRITCSVVKPRSGSPSQRQLLKQELLLINGNKKQETEPDVRKLNFDLELSLNEIFVSYLPSAAYIVSRTERSSALSKIGTDRNEEDSSTVSQTTAPLAPGTRFSSPVHRSRLSLHGSGALRQGPRPRLWTFSARSWARCARLDIQCKDLDIQYTVLSPVCTLRYTVQALNIQCTVLGPVCTLIYTVQALNIQCTILGPVCTLRYIVQALNIQCTVLGPVCTLRYTVQGSGHSVHGPEPGVHMLRYTVQGSGHSVHGPEPGVHMLRYTVQGSGHSVHDPGPGVHV
ncbi:hypothetical protein J6590_034833 [Homalodisca vitripennis]|nr:hypothetical protein J6590_034833 [Homalodisca vitripennis]